MMRWAGGLGWVCALAIFLPSAPARSQTVAPSARWEKEAVLLGGTGCFLDVDTTVSTAGNDLNVIFSNLGVDLGAPSNANLSESRSCELKVPLTIRPGFYPDSWDQSLVFGARKTAGASASLVATGQVVGTNLPSPSVNLPAGTALAVASQKSDTVASTDVLAGLRSAFCRAGRGENLEVAVRFTASGRRATVGDAVVAFGAQEDLRWSVRTSWKACP
jgi:hypothetical protein